jgi:hypothetical protein
LPLAAMFQYVSREKFRVGTLWVMTPYSLIDRSHRISLEVGSSISVWNISKHLPETYCPKVFVHDSSAALGPIQQNTVRLGGTSCKWLLTFVRNLPRPNLRPYFPPTCRCAHTLRHQPRDNTVSIFTAVNTSHLMGLPWDAAPTRFKKDIATRRGAAVGNLSIRRVSRTEG